MIKAIETEYNGYRFRSRLEARWAVFFDTLGVPYEYEPEGFDLGDGVYYLPDFRLKCHGTRGDYSRPPYDLYIEVKGVMTEYDAKKIEAFSKSYPILVVSNIPEDCEALLYGRVNGEDIGYGMNGTSVCAFNYETVDGDYFYPAIPVAHEEKVRTQVKNDDPFGYLEWIDTVVTKRKLYLMGGDSNYINREDIPLLDRALKAARSARFEHGEGVRV